jgi:outer membrane lipoprotein SlyB
LNTKALIVLGATATGAGLGALAGGPVGAGIGAGVGLAAGTVASVFLDRDHEVEVEIDKRGKLNVKVRPAKK